MDPGHFGVIIYHCEIGRPECTSSVHLEVLKYQNKEMVCLLIRLVLILEYAKHFIQYTLFPPAFKHSHSDKNITEQLGGVYLAQGQVVTQIKQLGIKSPMFQLADDLLYSHSKSEHK